LPAASAPHKLGLTNYPGWSAYFFGGSTFVKHVKVIKSGELTRKVLLKGIGATAGAKAAIEAAGGALA
jgi:hypothetical protein